MVQLTRCLIFAMASILGASLWVQAATNWGNVELTRTVIEAKRQAIVNDNLGLTESESKPFWDLYSTYQADMRKVNDMRLNVINSYAKNYKNLSAQQADALIKDYLKYQEDYLHLRKSYVHKFKKVMPETKVARFYQIENKLDAIINYELAAAIPLTKLEGSGGMSQN